MKNNRKKLLRLLAYVLISFVLFFSIECASNLITHKCQNTRYFILIEFASLVVYIVAMIFVLNVFLKKIDKLKLFDLKKLNLLTVVICPIVPLVIGIYMGTWIWDKSEAFSGIRSWVLIIVIIVAVAFADGLHLSNRKEPRNERNLD